MQLTLNDRQVDLLSRILRNYLPELRGEVYKTENYDWRQELKADEAVIKELIALLDRPATAPASAP